MEQVFWNVDKFFHELTQILLVWSGSEIYGTKLVLQTIIFKRNPKLPIVET